MGLAAGCVGADRETVSSTTSELTGTFGVGSLIIPLDRHGGGSDDLPSYGLVYRLLSNNVPVHWAIRAGKANKEADFQVAAPAVVGDLATSAALALPVTYHGGPFIIDAADRADAMPIVTAWLSSHPVTVVDEVTAGNFTAEIAKTLTAAPRIAVFDDGNADIATNAFNGAGIPDPNGDPWSTTAPKSPGILTPEEVGGTAASHTDGALWNADGTPSYCQLFSMHYKDDKTQATTDEAVAEVRAWLHGMQGNHAFMQCQAIVKFENNANGKFLSTGGMKDEGVVPNPLTDHVPDDPLTQDSGSLQAVTGVVESIGLMDGSVLRPNVEVLASGQATVPPFSRMWLLKGRLDGDAASGRITYLAGHDYLRDGEPSGVKVLLNSIFDAGCATPAGGQPEITLTKAGPAIVTGDEITYTIHYANTGSGVANNASIHDALPSGTTFASASSSGSDAGHPGTVSWNLGNLKPGVSGDVMVTVHVTSDGTYVNQATVSFQIGISPKSVPSNMMTTKRCIDGSCDPTPDRDHDGIPDRMDNCPDMPNFDQADRDHDGKGDACDSTDGLLGVSGGGCDAAGGGLGLVAAVALVALVVLRRRRAVVVAALITAAALPRPAAAQVMEPKSFGVERFQLASDRDGMFDVEWAEVRGDMTLSAALWAGLANDPLVLYEGRPGDRVGSLVANRAGGSLSASISPNRWLQLGFDLPLVVYQDRPGTSVLGMMESLSSFGTGNLRLVPKLVALHQAEYGVSLAFVPALIVPTRSTSDAYFDDRGFGFAPEVVLSRRWTGWRASVDAGYHARKRSQFLNQVVDDELFAHAGAGYQFADHGGPPVGVDLTLSGAIAARAPFQNFNEDHLETLAGATYDVTGDAQLFAGAGVGLRKGYGTPDWRGLVGVRMGFGRSHERALPPPRPPVPPAPARVVVPPPPPAPVVVPPPPPAPVIEPPPPPAPAPAPPPPPVVVNKCTLDLNESIHFKTDRAEIEPSSFDLLDSVVAALASHDKLNIQIEGHTDNQGSAAYNKGLSQRRAEAVVAYLVKKGIDKSRLTARGFGLEKPIADNDTDEGRAQNRRVVFAIQGCQGAGDDAK